MAKGIFGGDSEAGHFSASIPYRLPGESFKAQRLRRNASGILLRERGFKTKYHYFKKANKASKARAESLAKKDAKRWKGVCGEVLEINEGFFL